MNKYLTIAIVVSLVIGGIIGYVSHSKGVSLGSATDCIENTCFTSLFVTPGTFAVAGASTLQGDVTVSGGTLNVSTSNTATSTVVGGCVQTYATSTQTPWKQVVVASSTQIAPGYNGYILAQYGSCPNL